MKRACQISVRLNSNYNEKMVKLLEYTSIPVTAIVRYAVLNYSIKYPVFEIIPESHIKYFKRGREVSRIYSALFKYDEPLYKYLLDIYNKTTLSLSKLLTYMVMDYLRDMEKKIKMGCCGGEL